MKNVVLFIVGLVAMQASAAFLPYMKVECRDVEGLFVAKDSTIIFELQETPTPILEYTDISTNVNGSIGFTGTYVNGYYKPLPDGSSGDIVWEGRLYLKSKLNSSEFVVPNCREI